MSVRNKKKRFPVFWSVVILLLIVFFVGLILSMKQLKNSLAAYEDAQPEHLAEEIFARYFKGSVRYGELLDKTGCEAGFNSLEELTAYLTERTEGKEITYTEVYAKDDDHHRYAVMAGDDKIAAFTLRRGERVTFEFFGHEYHKIIWLFETYRWEEDSYELFWDASEKVSVLVPDGAAVSVNGIILSSDHLDGYELETDSCSHMPEGVQGLVFRRYTVEGLLSEPVVTATDGNGDPLSLAANENGVLVAEIPYSETLKAQYADYVLKAVESYACFMQEDLNLRDIRGYFDQNSALYENIRKTERFVWEHNSYEFINESIDRFYAYDENTFSCEVTFTHVLHKGKSTWSDTPLDMCVYLKMVDGKYVIYDMVNQ